MRIVTLARVVALAIVCTALGGCISGAPSLTSEQYAKLSQISAYKPGEAPAMPYKVVSEISGADCSGAPAGGRVWGNSEKAIHTLKTKAAALNADAIINVTCSAAPLVNNCWVAQKCTGTAVSFQ